MRSTLRRQDVKLDDLATIKTSYCSGDCLGINELPSSIKSSVELSKQFIRHTLPATEGAGRLYQPLLSSQTRLIQLPPSSAGDLSEIQLVTADVIATEGLRLADTRQSVDYIALSYCWNTTEWKTICCNGITTCIPKEVAVAMAHHRHSKERIYLWVDALSINQLDIQEKAAQVAIMLDIYIKAKSVTAWLGDASSDSPLALKCLEEHTDITERLQVAEQKSTHSSSCLAAMLRVHDAVLLLFERPYLSRTWIRQEVYAARKIIVACGSQKISWDAYIAGGQLLSRLARLCSKSTKQPRYERIISLLEDAEASQKSRRTGQIVPRDITEVLLKAKSYGVSVEQDTVYAVLRMCGIPATTQPAAQEQYTFTIDYTKTPEQVYHDLTVYILKTEPDVRVLRSLWHYQVGAGNDDTPTWVCAWRSARCNDTDMCDIRGIYELGNHQNDDDRRRKWYPRIAEEPSCPKVSNADSRALEVQGRAMNYVAYVSDYTCTLKAFSDLSGRNILESAARSIHLQARPDRGGLFSRPPDLLLERFDPQEHAWRIAILGVAIDQQLALVPAATAKGDVILAMAGLLPMVFSPLRNTYAHELYTNPDPYERILFERKSMARRCYDARYLMWLHRHVSIRGVTRYSACASSLTLMAFLIALSVLPIAIVEQDWRTKLALGIVAGLCILVIITLLLYECIPYIRFRRFDKSSFVQKRNFGVLDHLTEKHDPRYRLRGPVFVRQRVPWPSDAGLSDLEANRSIRKHTADRPVQKFLII